MNNTNDSENLKQVKAARREQKNRPRMRMRGRSLKQKSQRPILHIHKKTRKKK